jgi:uncharacterized membrane protein YpjA
VILKQSEIVCLWQLGSGRHLQAMLLGKTWLLSAISGSIAAASCVLNDFFDYAVDVINDPSKVHINTYLSSVFSLTDMFSARCGLHFHMRPRDTSVRASPVEAPESRMHFLNSLE